MFLRLCIRAPRTRITSPPRTTPCELRPITSDGQGAIWFSTAEAAPSFPVESLIGIAARSRLRPCLDRHDGYKPSTVTALNLGHKAMNSLETPTQQGPALARFDCRRAKLPLSNHVP